MFTGKFSLFLFISLVCWPLLATAAEVNIYSARKEALIKPLLDRFEKEHGIKVNMVTGKGDALLTRLKAEAKNSPADLLITTDVGRLHRAKSAGVLQAIPGKAINVDIPAEYRDSSGFWYGLSLRARVVIYAPDRVDASELLSYEGLADKKWKKRLCVRSSDNIYNQSLVASLIAHKGSKATDEWLKGLVSNFARPPRGGDRDQIKAVAIGQCDLALVNSYYLGAMLRSDNPAEKKAAEQVALFWPNQKTRGAHINVSGAGVTAAAPNRDNAIALLNFLLSEQSQQWYADVNNEYPVIAGVEANDILKSWGDFKPDSLAVEKLGEFNSAAVKAMDRAGWK